MSGKTRGQKIDSGSATSRNHFRGTPLHWGMGPFLEIGSAPP